ncbi:dynein axonemal heavy chain 6-like [Engraulis encrasicolus]|uniref:dynein axonemal heavy chain 6-like n=1 Tax=Engraulis encrasicolus TaxID=184585 RepID=UPI002FD31958
MHPKHMCLVEEDESTCGSTIVRRPDTLPKLEPISSKNQSVGVLQQQPLSKETNRVTATRGVTLKPLQRRTHQPRWDSLVIPPTWNYKGVRVKGARFDNTEPEDDDVVRHIVRLRSKRGWPTILPGHQQQKRTKTYSDHPQGGSHGTQDTGEYVYCIRRNEGDVQYNPYELKVVSVQTAKQHSRYWTISATCVQEVSVLQQYSEVVPVMDWLADRDLFHKIYLLPFFSKFRDPKDPKSCPPPYGEMLKWKMLMKRFGRFLAMVDYMFETVLSDLLRATVSTLHSSLWASYHHAQAGVKLEDAGGTTQADAESSDREKTAEMTISPSMEDFMEKIQQVLDGFCNVIVKQIPLFKDPSLLDLHRPSMFTAELFDVSEEEGSAAVRSWPDLQLLLGQDAVYQMQVSEVLSMVKRSFDEAERRCVSMQKFCKMVSTAMFLHVDSFLEEETWTAQDLKAVLMAHVDSVQQMLKMRMEKRVNMMLISCRQYQRDCLPYPQTLLHNMHMLLPTFVQRKNLDLMEVIQSALRNLQSSSETLDEFVDHLNFLSEISVKLPGLERQYHFLVQLYSIVKQFNIIIPAENLALFRHLIYSFANLKSTILICETKRDDKIFTFITDLSKQLSKLRHDLILIRMKIFNPLLVCASTSMEMATELLQTLAEDLDTYSCKAYSYFRFRELLGRSFSRKNKGSIANKEEVTDAVVEQELNEVSNALTLRRMLWDMQREWHAEYAQWRATPFELLNVDDLQNDVNRFTQTIYILTKGLPENDIVPQLKQKLGDFKQCLPIIIALRNPHLRRRHIEEMQKNVGRFFLPDDGSTLGDLLDLKILQHSRLVSEISSTATHEATLETILSKVIELWSYTDFRLITHTSESCTVKIIASADDVMMQLEESQTTIMSLKSSRYVEPIKGSIDEWDRKLKHFSSTLSEWVTCQKRWLYLEAIFSAVGIQRQLPTEAKLFEEVNEAWKQLMLKTEQDPNALRNGTFPGVLEDLQNNNSQLEKIQKCLEDYLESKRNIFPRFYFLSNEELISVLTQSRNPSVIQPFLVKCFSNIYRLEMQEQTLLHPLLVQLHSLEGETITMPTIVQIRGPVEQWMGNVETAMYNAVKRHMRLAVADWNPDDFTNWAIAHPGQVVLTVTQIMFSSDCERCLSGGSGQREGLRAVQQQMIGSVEALTALAFKQLASHKQATVETLFTILVHCRDILSHLIQHNVISADNFEWRRQLLYNWHDSTSLCYVVQAKSSFAYGYEYQGCSPRLVITPLTDRCWLTLTGALSLHLGGALVGPTATGKTESVKDLAKALGKFCLVMNCSASLDYKMMGKLYSGMVQSGAWCCFDEFNSISVKVLSVIAAQLQSIRAAKNSHSTRFTFEGRDIRLNASCGYFITMNPRYGGRVELPDNLKILVRPVAMMVPDFHLIAEIILFSTGFKSAKTLSRKIVHLYQVASKQLSQQDHYDFSMRSIKPVLLLAGHKRRAVMLVSLSSEEEYCILICALQEFNLPKLIPEDVPLFQGIMHDLFPEVVAPKAVHPQLENAITKAIDALGLQRCPIQAEKVTQLYSQILAHTGVMLVGPTGGGKTTIRLILQHALEIMPAFMHRSSFLWGNELYMDCFTINPKCVELGELFGQMNPNTLEWSDGLLASAIRNYAKELSQGEKKPTPATAEVPANNPGPGAVQRPPTVNSYQGAPPGAPVIEKWRWVIMDGPVDSLWVESLNTALDESSTLCLINGERINLPDGLSFLFEVDSLSHATPATISRCAMVYVDPVGKAWKLYVDRWLSQLSSFMKEHGVAYLKKLMYGTVNQGVFFVHSHRKLLSFRVPELSLVMTLCSILNSIFNLLHKNGGLGQNEDKTCHNVYTSGRSGLQDCGRRRRRTTACNEEVKWFLQKYPDKLTSLLGKLYVFAFTWAFGGVLNHMNEYDDAHGNYRDKSDPLVKASHEFQTLLRELFEGGQHYGIPLPSGNLFSYFVDMQTDSFVLWEELVPSTEILIRRGLTPGRRDVASAYSAVYSGRDTLTPNSQHVSNLDSIRYSFLISLLLVHDQPVLLTGDSGVGKSMLIESMLKKLQRDQGDIGNPSTILGQVFLHHQAKTVSLLEDVSLLTDGLTDNDYPYGDSTDMVSAASPFGKLHSMEQEEGMGSSESGILTRPFQCTAHTGPQHIKAHVLHGLTKRGQNLLGASKNRKVLIFLDDINMPVPDESGVQPSMELLRQFIEADGVHDTKTLSWKGIQDVTFFAACAPPGGGRQQLSKRLLRHFSLLALPHPSYSTMSHIFQVQLGKFLVSGDFCMEVQQCRETLVSAAIAIYLEMCHSVLPSPARYHYTYNLRDLYKVIHGLMQCHSSEVRTDEALAYLLANEASRVFHDRLMSDEDRQIFCQIVANELQIHFKVFWGAESMMKEPVMFADFLDPTVPIASRVYKHIRDKNKILPVLEDCHNKHCKTKSGFPMVFFREAVEHVTRAARIFRQQGSHMMLIGLDGTGKESCVTLACHLAACRLYRLSVSRNCSYSDFRDDIRRVFYLTGVEQLDTVLLITDPEILKESVMKDLDCLLKCGDLPGLFNSEDIDNITADLRTRGRVWEKREEAYTQFTKQVKQRLHVVLTMSPAGSRLRQFCWSHPALLGCCNIDWYSPWSKESLLQVARSMYINAEDYYLGEGLHELVAQACVDMHYSISQMAERYGQEARRPYYVVPSIFSEFMGTFFKMLRSREGDLHSIRNRYTKGLAILLESTSYITVMKEELVALSEKIEEKTEEIETLMSKLQRDADIVEQVRAIVQMEENIMIQETQIVQDYAQEAQVDLKTALPLLEKAREALDGLDKNDISEIRVYTNPPDLVLTVMYAVCILLQQKPTWAVAKVLLGDPGFLKKLVGLDKDTLPDKVSSFL